MKSVDLLKMQKKKFVVWDQSFKKTILPKKFYGKIMIFMNIIIFRLDGALSKQNTCKDRI